MSTARPLSKAGITALICLAFVAAPGASAAARPAHETATPSARKSGHIRSRCAARGARRASRGRCRGAAKPEARPHRRTRPSVPPASAPVAQRSAAASVAATIAAVLATPCQNTELTPEAGDVALVREAVLCLINRKRAEYGESPLVADSELEQAAEGHCQELIADDYFAHVSPSGETPVDRIRDTGYIPSPDDGYVIGENLAWGTYQLSTPQSIVSAWFASPEHLANILESKYRETGIGVTPAVPASVGAGAPGATYAQEFGVIIP